MKCHSAVWQLGSAHFHFLHLATGVLTDLLETIDGFGVRRCDPRLKYSDPFSTRGTHFEAMEASARRSPMPNVSSHSTMQYSSRGFVTSEHAEGLKRPPQRRLFNCLIRTHTLAADPLVGAVVCDSVKTFPFLYFFVCCWEEPRHVKR